MNSRSTIALVICVPAMFASGFWAARRWPASEETQSHMRRLPRLERRIPAPPESSGPESGLSSWARVDFEAALAFARSQDSPRKRDTMLREVLAGSADVGGAWRHLGLVSSDRQRREIRAVLFGRMASEDPDSALGVLRGIESDAERVQMIGKGIEDGRLDLYSAAAFLQEIPAGIARNDLVDELSRRLLERDEEEFLHVLSFLPAGTAREEGLAAAASKRAVRDLDGAISLVQRMAPGRERIEAWDRIFSAATMDPLEMLARAESVPGERQRRMITFRVLDRLAEADPDRALDFVDPSDDGYRQLNLVRAIAGSWAADDPGDAWARVNRFTNEEQRRAARQRVISGLAKNDPEAAAGFLATLGDDLDEAMVRNVTHPWGDVHPERAANWLLSSTSPEARGTALNQVMADWAGVEPAAAVNWIRGVPASAERDGAVRAAAFSILYRTPQAAAEMVPLIVNPDIRADVCEAVVRNWADFDRAAARVWLDSTGLSPEAVNRIRQHLENQPPEGGSIGFPGCFLME